MTSRALLRIATRYVVLTPKYCTVMTGPRRPWETLITIADTRMPHAPDFVGGLALSCLDSSRPLADYFDSVIRDLIVSH